MAAAGQTGTNAATAVAAMQSRRLVKPLFGPEKAAASGSRAVAVTSDLQLQVILCAIVFNQLGEDAQTTDVTALTRQPFFERGDAEKATKKISKVASCGEIGCR